MKLLRHHCIILSLFALAAVGGGRALAQQSSNPARAHLAGFSHLIRLKRDPGHQHTSHKLRQLSIKNMISAVGLALALSFLSTGCLTFSSTEEELARKRERVREHMVELYSDWEPPNYESWSYTSSGGWGGSPNIDIGAIDVGGFCPGSGVGCPGK